MRKQEENSRGDDYSCLENLVTLISRQMPYTQRPRVAALPAFAVVLESALYEATMLRGAR